jgi:uncharacterized protein
MKIVFDTNVLFAAFAARGLVHSVFEFCLENHTIIISEHILDELERHLGSKLLLPAGELGMIKAFLREVCSISGESDVDPSACRDRNDLKILGVAEKARAGLIMTGDEDLLILKEFRAIPILTPRQFWERTRKPAEKPSPSKRPGSIKRVHET